jgi:hypothetical protein
LSCIASVSVFKLELPDKPSNSLTQLIDISHYVTSPSNGKQVSIAVLCSHFYNDNDSERFMPEIPLTVLTTLDLPLLDEKSSGQAPKSKFSSKESFSRSTPGIFNVENLHPTSRKIISNGDNGILVFNSQDVSYFDKSGQVSCKKCEN